MFFFLQGRGFTYIFQVNPRTTCISGNSPYTCIIQLGQGTMVYGSRNVHCLRDIRWCLIGSLHNVVPHIRVWTCTHPINFWTIHMCIYIHIHIDIKLYIYIIYIYIYTYSCMYIYIYVYTYVCVYIYIYTYTYMCH